MARLKGHIATGLAGLMLLAGCTGSSVISRPDLDSYSAGETAGQDLPVSVRGDPFGIAQRDFDRDVRDAMQGASFGQPMRFVAEDASPGSAYRVIMDFAGGDTTESAACAKHDAMPAASAAGAQNPSRVPLTAVLCRGDRAIAYASGSVGAAGGPQGEEFREGVSDFTRADFPAQVNSHLGNKGKGP